MSPLVQTTFFKNYASFASLTPLGAGVAFFVDFQELP